MMCPIAYEAYDCEALAYPWGQSLRQLRFLGFAGSIRGENVVPTTAAPVKFSVAAQNQPALACVSTDEELCIRVVSHFRVRVSMRQAEALAQHYLNQRFKGFRPWLMP